MSSFSKTIIMGNLGRDPEVRQTPSGQSVARFSVATSRRWKDKEGNQEEKTQWHNVVVWGKQADTCGQYLSKGRAVLVEGEIEYRTYDDKDGNKKYITELIARDVRFLGGGGGGGAVAATDGDAEPAEKQDDIPF